MVLLNATIQIDALPDSDWFRLAPFLQPIRHIAGQDRFVVSLAIINDTPPWPFGSLESLAKESLGGGEIPPLAKSELNRVTVVINGAA